MMYLSLGTKWSDIFSLQCKKSKQSYHPPINNKLTHTPFPVRTRYKKMVNNIYAQQINIQVLTARAMLSASFLTSSLNLCLPMRQSLSYRRPSTSGCLLYFNPASRYTLEVKIFSYILIPTFIWLE